MSINKPLFIHIPKTAGTSIAESLLKNYSTGNLDIDRSLLGTEHFTQSQLESRCVYFGYIPDFKFTVIRNPFDRFFSLYLHLKRKMIRLYESGYFGEPYHILGYIWCKSSFQEFTKFFLVNSVSGHWMINYHMSLPQSAFLDSDEDIEIFNFNELNKIEDKLNLKLPHVNSNNLKVDYRHMYDEETYNIVLNYYKVDFDRFNFSKEL